VCDPLLAETKNAERSCSEQVKEARGERRDFNEDEAFTLAWNNSCEVCRLFGSSFLASRIRIADLPLSSTPEEAPVYVRDGVGLDRDLRTASRKILYSFEAVSGGAQFTLRIEFENAEPYEMGLLLVGLDLFKDGLATVGGKSARGLGLARIEDLAVVRKTAEDFFSGSAGAQLGPEDLQAFRAAARTHYLEGN
jgi:CRISPR-associated RAMP protein (TIGR02581 family)